MTTYSLLPLIQALFCLVLIAIVLKGHLRSFTHRLFSLFLLGLAIWGIIIFTMRASPDIEHAYFWERWLIPVGPFISVLFYHFSIRYTTTKINRWLLPVFYSICVLFIPAATTPLVFSSMQIKSYGYAPIFGPLMSFWMLFTYTVLLMALLNFIRMWRASAYAEQRNRAVYISIGIAFALVGGVFDVLPVLGLPLYPGAIIGNLAFCFLTTVAIMRHQLLDIRIVLRRSTAYFLISALIALPFIAIFILTTKVFTEVDFPSWIYFVVAIMLALVLPYLWRWVQQRVDRWFNRDRYDYLKALDNFSRDTHSLTDSSKLGFTMVDLVAKALRSASIYLLQPQPDSRNFTVVCSAGTNRPTKSTADILIHSQSPLIKWLEHHDKVLTYQDLDIIPQLQSVIYNEKQDLERIAAELIVPIGTRTGHLSGLLVLSRKRSQEPYTIEDKQLIYAIGSQMAMALENARLYRDASRARENLEVWLDSMTDCVIIVNTDYKVKFMNRAGVVRFRGKPGQACWHALGKDSECSYCPMEDTLYNPRNGFNFLNTAGDRYYDVAAAPLMNPDGSLSMIEVLRDITDRKQAEAEKKELEEKAQLASRLSVVGEMASGIAHEINNPLTGVIGYTQLLMRKDIPEDAKEHLVRIRDSSERVASIIKRLLAFARQHKLERTYVNINDIVEDTIELRAYALETNNITVISKLDPDLPYTMADAGQIQQVFINIVINAEKEMKLAHGKGNLFIETEMVDDIIRISFKDDGPGIAEHNLERIFDPFFTTRKVGEGTGLGLSICHGIIAEHAGKIYVESKLGQGANFIIELPIVPKEEQPELAVPSSEESYRGDGEKVLVVDDETVIQQLLTEILTDEGFEVETVGSADDAMDRLESTKYSLVLLDIKVPGMSGIELYEYIQNIDQSLAKRVVFITGDVMGKDTRVFLSKTKIPYITKPFNTEQLTKDLARVLTQSKQRFTA
jgi:signal transduction histidine kinase/ActR/RegA family two-component response regulator